MNLLVTLLSLLAIVLLTAGTALFVAAEFSLTTLERSTVDANARRGGRRDQYVQRAHHTLSFQLSGAQLGISITTLITGYLTEPLVAELPHPGHGCARDTQPGRRRDPHLRDAAGRHLVVDDLRRADPEKHCGGPSPGDRAGRRRIAVAVLVADDGADSADQRRWPTGSCASWASNRPRNSGRPVRRRSWSRWSARRPAAVRWIRRPPRCWTGRCSSAN